MYNRYIGNTGKVIRVEEDTGRQEYSPNTEKTHRPGPEHHSEPKAHVREMPDNRAAVRQKKPSLLASLGSIGSLGGGLAKTIDSSLPFGLETADLILLALFLFLYIESGDEEFLIILGFLAYSFIKDGKE